MIERERNTPQPSPESGLTFQGMSFAEFKALTDAEVNALVQDYLFDYVRARAEAEALGETISIDDEDNFLKFYFWRKQGIPDVDMQEQEIIECVKHDVKIRKEIQPTYGTVPAEHEQLRDTERIKVSFMMHYLHSNYGVTRQPLLSQADLLETIGMSSGDVWRLKQKGVLTVDSFTGKHALTGQYLGYRLVNHPDIQ